MLNLPMDHIGLHCSDVELNAKWYQEELGFKVAGNSLEWAEEMYISLRILRMEKCMKSLRETNFQEVPTTRIDHIAYRSSDLEKDYEYCKANGYKIVSDGIETSLNFWEKGSRASRLKVLVEK